MALALPLTLAFAGCGAEPPATFAPERERHYVEGVRYDIPLGWQTESDSLGGYTHAPPDGGLLYASKVLYTAADFTDEAKAAEVLTLERDRMMSSVENAKLLEEEGQVWKNVYSLSVWFYGDINGQRSTFYARIFPYDTYLYSFLFAFPNSEENLLKSSRVEIEESIFIPSQAREEGPSSA